MKTTLTLLALGFATFASLPANAADEAYSGTLYRNGGNFGLENSDVSLEQAQPIIAGAPSNETAEPEAAPTPTWNGTLYRNGGHYGLENSEDNLYLDP